MAGNKANFEPQSWWKVFECYCHFYTYWFINAPNFYSPSGLQEQFKL